MNLDEFMVAVEPAKQRSKLKPHHADIVKLREQGYTLDQVCEFLARNAVITSPSNVASYLRRAMARGQSPHQAASAALKGHADAPAPASPASPVEPAKAPVPTPKPRAPVKPLEPGELRAIARNRPDLNELARIGREAVKAERSRKA